MIIHKIFIIIIIIIFAPVLKAKPITFSRSIKPWQENLLEECLQKSYDEDDYDYGDDESDDDDDVEDDDDDDNEDDDHLIPWSIQDEGVIESWTMRVVSRGGN